MLRILIFGILFLVGSNSANALSAGQYKKMAEHGEHWETRILLPRRGS